jgi:hypothetical protein
MKKSIVIIGAGQIGSRHLQALALLQIPCQIFVLNPFVNFIVNCGVRLGFQHVYFSVNVGGGGLFLGQRFQQ